MSTIFSEMCSLLEIRKTRTTPYHPSGNSQVERFNRNLIQMIKAYIKDEQRNWDQNLGCLAGAYRASVHESTVFTPNLLMFGREVRLPAELMFCPPPEGHISSYGEYVSKQRKQLEKAHDICREHLSQSTEHQQELYDAKSTLRKYSPGVRNIFRRHPSGSKIKKEIYGSRYDYDKTERYYLSDSDPKK